MAAAAELYAVVSDYDLLIEALAERRLELNIDCNELDRVGGLADGYSAKCLGGSQTQRLGWISIFQIVRPLGLRIVLERDDAIAAEFEAEQRNGNQALAVGLAVVGRGRARHRFARHVR